MFIFTVINHILQNISVYFLESVETQDVFPLSYTYKTTIDNLTQEVAPALCLPVALM